MCFINLLNRPIWNKMSLFHIETLDLEELFHSKLSPLSEGNKAPVAPVSKVDVFPGVIHVFLQHY
jgi:hypothetical protein